MKRLNILTVSYNHPQGILYVSIQRRMQWWVKQKHHNFNKAQSVSEICLHDTLSSWEGLPWSLGLFRCQMRFVQKIFDAPGTKPRERVQLETSARCHQKHHGQNEPKTAEGEAVDVSATETAKVRLFPRVPKSPQAHTLDPEPEEWGRLRRIYEVTEVTHSHFSTLQCKQSTTQSAFLSYYRRHQWFRLHKQ